MSDATSKHVLIYDDHCPMCTFQMRMLTWLDWFDVLRMQPLGDAKSAEWAEGIRREDLLEAIHCVTPDGRIYRGARALRFVSLRIPLLVPLALVLWTPGVIYVAERIYGWVSRNRQLLSRLFGCKEACAILPARKRSETPLEADSAGESAEPLRDPRRAPGTANRT